MFTEINEPVEVMVKFSSSKSAPFKFVWNHREYMIKKINLTYSSREGGTKIYYFAVSDDVNYFKLKFNTDNLNWTLLEVYTD